MALFLVFVLLHYCNIRNVSFQASYIRIATLILFATIFSISTLLVNGIEIYTSISIAVLEGFTILDFFNLIVTAGQQRINVLDAIYNERILVPPCNRMVLLSNWCTSPKHAFYTLYFSVAQYMICKPTVVATYLLLMKYLDLKQSIYGTLCFVVYNICSVTVNLISIGGILIAMVAIHVSLMYSSLISVFHFCHSFFI